MMYAKPVCRGSWALGTACGRCERCNETRPTGTPPAGLNYRLMLLDLLAIIHRDGGHRTEELGIKLSHEHAMQLSSERIAATTAKDAEIADLRAHMGRLGMDGPNQRYWEARYRDEETRATKAEAKLETCREALDAWAESSIMSDYHGDGRTPDNAYDLDLRHIGKAHGGDVEKAARLTRREREGRG